MRKTMVLTLLAATSFSLVTIGQAHAATASYTTTFKYVDATTNKTLMTVKITGSKNKTYTYKPVRWRLNNTQHRRSCLIR